MKKLFIMLILSTSIVISNPNEPDNYSWSYWDVFDYCLYVEQISAGAEIVEFGIDYVPVGDTKKNCSMVCKKTC